MAPDNTRSSCQTRHAVILAAGESKRTRPLTLQRPKPLIPLLGKPLLAHIMDELVGLIERVTLVVGYRADDIRAHVGTSYRGMQITYVDQHVANGTAGALLVVADQDREHGMTVLDESFFLLYGDNLISQTDILNVGQQRYCMAALPVNDPTGFGILDVVDGNVRRIIEKPPDAPPGSLANPGIYHFDPAVFPALRQIEPSPRGEYELTDLIAALAQKNAVGCRVCAGHWVPVGNPWEVLIAAQFLLQQRAALRPDIHPQAQIDSEHCRITGYAHIGAGTHIHGHCSIIGPAYIGNNVTIDSDCVIDGSVIEDGASVGAGCVIKNSMPGRNARVAATSVLENCLLDDGASVGEGTKLRARIFDDVKPVASTGGLLDDATLRRRGVVLGPDVHLPAAAEIEPGAVCFPDADSPAH